MRRKCFFLFLAGGAIGAVIAGASLLVPPVESHPGPSQGRL